MWIIYLLMFSACMPKNEKYGGDGDGKWPESWNADMEIALGYGGGMTPEHWEMNVKGDSATYEYNYSQNKTIVKVLLTKEELDSIADIVHKVEPHKIRMKEHAVIYDKGSTFVRIRHKSRILTLSEGATESFTDGGWKDFSKIYNLVFNMVERKAKKSMINLTINVNCTGGNGYWSHIQNNHRTIKMFGCNDTARTETIRIYPGSHAFFAYVFKSEDGQYRYSQKTWPFNNFTLRMTKDTVLNFMLKDSILELKR